jgi:hypothetical protein
MLIPDKDQDNVLFQDEEITAMLNLSGTSVLRAAALGVDTVARDNAMVLKVISLLDLRTDGATLSRALHDQAESLRAIALEEEAREGSLFDTAEMVTNAFTLRNRVWNQMLRTLGSSSSSS